jgi:hypothetical protein
MGIVIYFIKLIFLTLVITLACFFIILGIFNSYCTICSILRVSMPFEGSIHFSFHI